MSAAAPACTVVVCTRSRPALLDRCLAAVSALTYPGFDVLVVDNAPPDSQARAVAGRWRTRYILEPRRGLSRARNAGARASASAVLAYLDDDAVPEPSWLDALTAEFADPRVMAATGRILPIEETQAPDIRAWRAGLDCGAERRAVDRDTPHWFEMANFGGVGDGGSMAIRRAAFEHWPGFHERLGRGALVNGGEEHHAFFSLVDRGFRVVYTPHARVRHPFPGTAADLRRRQLRDATAAAAYMTLLFVEEPRYRRRVLSYVAGWLGGARRTWRANRVPAASRLAARWRMLAAYGAGPLLYACSRVTGSWPLADAPGRALGGASGVLDLPR